MGKATILRTWRGPMLGAVALTLAGAGVGIATAGEGDSRPTEYWPTVAEQDLGPAYDPSIFFPTIEDASLTCAADGTYEVRLVASSQPGSAPRRGSTPPAAGDLVVQAGFRAPVNPTSTPDGWGEGGDRFVLQGDSMSTGDIAPTNPGWLVFVGTRAVPAKLGPEIPEGLDQGVRLIVEIAKYEQRVGGVQVVLRKQAQTVLPYPDCP